MNADEFRKCGREMVDYIADHLENIETRRPLADVQPGYMAPMLPTSAPEEPETWKEVMDDIERVIMPGVTHWNHPQFHAYFPTGNSYPAILGDMLSDAIGCIGFSWFSSPACTELEVIVLDWLAKMLDLPEKFMSSKTSGGVIQGTASEATLVALLAARSRKLKTLNNLNTYSVSELQGKDISKLVAYCSTQSHSSVERACLMGAVHCRKIAVDQSNAMKSEELRIQIKKDIEEGLIPFYCVGTLGTTSTVAFDPITEIGPICNEYSVWFHIDAAYAGSSFICPEYRHFLNGVENAQSFNFNPHKWMLVNFDCSTMWMEDCRDVVGAFNVDPLYLQHQHQDKAPDYRHWQIPLGRRFRSLKLWFVLRLIGIKGLQKYIRTHIELAKEFEKQILECDRFEVTHEVILGLVCFRMKNSNKSENEKLMKIINEDGRIHMVPGEDENKGYFLRFCICGSKTELRHVEFACKVIRELASSLNQ